MNSVCLRTPLSITQLIEVCVNSFDNDDVNVGSFASAFFHTHEWIIDSNELMSQFLLLFQKFSVQPDQQLRVCRAVAYWIRSCPTHFDPTLCRLVDSLRQSAASVEIPDATALLDTTALPSYPWLRNVSLRNPVGRQISLSFEQWSAEDISASLSHIDYRALYRIPIKELKKYCIDGNLSSTPILERSISIFNSLTNWVQCMVLSKSTPSERAEMMTKFINVGKHLRKMNNFNTLMAVIGGVTHSSIARLYKTNSALTADMKNELSSLTMLLSSQFNFSNYRAVLKSTSSVFRIPIMGVHLKDLIAFHSKLGGKERSRTFSCEQILNLSALLSFFVCFNRTPHNFPDASIDLINTLKVSLDIRYNEDDIYHLSLKREPRTLLSFQTPAKSVVFADWASGVCSAPEPEVVNKHVSAMVEAVFKHYDHDKDGYISQTEFQQIVGNFPFIAPFGTIDVDRDGQISKSEMKAYFIQVNKQSMEFRQEFKHNFHEATFLTPTSCAHCGKLLWGFIRQGFKCKDCDVIVHGYCKDSAVIECRHQPIAVSNLYSMASNSTKQGKKLFLGVSHKKRIRTVSAMSEKGSPDDRAECSISTACRSLIRIRPDSSKGRARSEAIDYLRCRSSLDSPDEDTVASLASEEVFDDVSPCISVSDYSPSDQPVDRAMCL